MKNLKTIRIEPLLLHGAENAISASELCHRLHITPRILRLYIATERTNGAEILFSPGSHSGYFLPSQIPEQGQLERLVFYRAMRARAYSTFRTLQPISRSLGIPIGQLELDNGSTEDHAQHE